MGMKTIANGKTYITALKLAAAAECDPRTALKALESGIQSVRGAMTRERLDRAFNSLGLEPLINNTNEAA
jgi:hypothetical protein